MDHARAQVILPNTSGIPAEGYVMDFSFTMDDTVADATAAGQLATALINFFNTTPTGGTHGHLSRWVGEQVNRAANACHVKVYDISGHLDASPTGSPILDQPFTLAAPDGSGSFPDEVAVVMTLRGFDWQYQVIEGATDDIPTPPAAQRMGAPATHTGHRRPRQSRTGRLYFGPLMATLNESAPGPGIVGDSCRLGLLDSAVGLQAEVQSNGHNWSVWSRRLATMFNVVQVEVDNAYDTQRRRGRKATVRTTRAV